MVSARLPISLLLAMAFPLAMAVPSARAQLTAPPAAARAAAKVTPEERGDIYMARKMYREAIDAYMSATPVSAVLWDKIGISYHQLGDLNAAKKSYERALKLDKTYADAVNNIGTIYYAQKKYRSAIAAYVKALRIAPDSASVWGNLGTAYYARKQFEQMNKAYAKALELDPLVFAEHNAVGTRMQDRSVEDRARFDYEMAKLYAGAGKNDLALQHLRKALEEGFKDKDKLNQAKEFSTLRETQEFKDLMAAEPRVL
jgi:tetratricopeptide (TPR) repeat protein